MCVYVYIYMSGGQNYLFLAIATGETGSSPIGCEDFRSLITSSSKRCSLYSPACSRCCRNKRPPDYYCGNVLESRGIGAGSSPIGCEGFVKASKVQGSSLLLSNANNFVRYSYVDSISICYKLYIYIYIHRYASSLHINSILYRLNGGIRVALTC